MSLSRYIGQKNVLGRTLTATNLKTLEMVAPGVMHYKLRLKSGKMGTRVFKPLATPVMIAELEKKIRKVRKNKGTTRKIGLAGMKIAMPRGRARKFRFAPLVTPGSAIGLAGMKVLRGRGRKLGRAPLVTPGSAIGLAGMKIVRGRARKLGRAPLVTPGSAIGLAGMKVAMPLGRPRKFHRVLVTPGSAIGLAGMKIMMPRKVRKNKGVKRASRTRKVRSVPTGGARKVRTTRRQVRSA